MWKVVGEYISLFQSECIGGEFHNILELLKFLQLWAFCEPIRDDNQWGILKCNPKLVWGVLGCLGNRQRQCFPYLLLIGIMCQKLQFVHLELWWVDLLLHQVLFSLPLASWCCVVGGKSSILQEYSQCLLLQNIVSFPMVVWNVCLFYCIFNFMFSKKLMLNTIFAQPRDISSIFCARLAFQLVQLLKNDRVDVFQQLGLSLSMFGFKANSKEITKVKIHMITRNQ